MRLIVASLASFVLAACSQGSDTSDRLPAFFDCIRETDAVLVSAHRGGPGPGLPENSIAAMENTLAAGPALIELDVRATRDGVLVLMHDETLDRTTTGSGEIAFKDYRALGNVRLLDPNGRATDQPIPTLREALSAARGKGLVTLDIRGVPYGRVVEAVREARAMDEVVFITYRLGEALALRRADRNAMISLNIDSEDELRDALGELDDSTRLVAWTGTGRPNPALNRQLDAAGVEASLGTFSTADRQRGRNAAEAYRALRDQGVDIIATNTPLKVFAALPPDGVGACLTQ